MAGFDGFSPDALQFLVDLAQNNDRAWFQPRKAQYERLLKRPLESLCAALGDEFASRRLPFRADPTSSPFRIYRDVRFARDKSPYKTNVGAQFPWVDGAMDERAVAERGAGPGLGGYLHVAPGESFVGGGSWHPDRPLLEAWRRVVDQEPERVDGAVGAPEFTRWFGILDAGDTYSRVPPGYAADHPRGDLLRLRHLTFGHQLADDELASPALPRMIADAFEAAVPMFTLLRSIGA